jgi:hypothetical protein
MAKYKKVKAWAVMNKEDGMPTAGISWGGKEKETALYIETYFFREFALMRKSWINKPDQKYYKVVACTILLPEGKKK